ncbi:MAG: YegS/Rv2252/BmrU family lipid kinase [Clostridiales bacterium]|nr:YegS/Rv2252/BmrU family lipid kinase [Clostridiales bacterium]
MKHIFLIVNPTAGMGAARERLFDILTAFAEEGCVTTVALIQPEWGPMSDTLLREADDTRDIIVCYGGDGTLSRTIDSYVRLGMTRPIGYLPAGSTNDFARSLGLPGESVRGARAIARGKVFRYDLGVFNDSFFNYVAAFGAFTKVSYETNQAFKNILGYAAYVLSALFAVGEAMNVRCPMVIEHDGKKEEGSFIFGSVSNSTSVAGFRVPYDKEARMDDGLFEVLLIRAPENIVDFTAVLGCLASGNLTNPYIELFQTDDLVIHSKSKAAWTLDGEYGGNPESIHISMLRRRIPLILDIPDAAEQAVPAENS